MNILSPLAREMTTATTIIAAEARVGNCHLGLPLSRASVSTVKPIRRSFSSGVRCAVFPQGTRESRRFVSFSLVFLHFFSPSKDAMSASLVDKLDKYVKKKKLDPLEAYIPAVILTALQIKELGQNLESNRPQFADCRNLLRSGPASSLRANIRAVAQYASDAGNGKYAFDEVDECLRALEQLDSLLLRASREKSEPSVEPMKAQVTTALNALNSLLKTVPADVLDKGKAMADAYLTPGEEDSSPENLDPQLKKLESIL